MRFSNGARILAGSSNPKFFRGKGGDADADEFAFHEHPKDLLKAMHATARVWGHQLRLWSTHNGDNSYFNTLCTEAKKSAGTEPRRGFSAKHFRVSILDAVNQGLVEKIKRLSAPDLTARQDWLEELRASCPSEDTWREEYLCEPQDGNAALLSYEMIEACETARNATADNAPAPAELRTSPTRQRLDPRLMPSRQPTSALYAGFDVGRKHDRSVLWVVERVGNVLHTRTVRVLEAMPFSEQESILNAAMQDRTICRLCIDSTGIGAMLAERLSTRWRDRVEGIHFTSAVKSDLAMPLMTLFQDRQIRIPTDPIIREDLHKVRRVITAAGNVRFDATRDEAGHADRFWRSRWHATRRPINPSERSR